MREAAWTLAADGVRLRVRVTPRGGRDAAGGMVETRSGSALAVRVRAVPSDGEANAAVRELLATALDRPARAVSLVAGGTARVKIWAVAGDPAILVERLRRLANGETA